MRWPRDSWPWQRSLLLLLAIAVVYIAATFLCFVLGAVAHLYTIPLDGPRNLPFLLTVQLVTYVPLVVTIVVGLPLVARLPLRELGFRAPTARDIGAGLAGAVAMFLATFVVSQLVAFAGIKSSEQSVEVFKHLASDRDRALFVALACVFAPISEEIFFRVFVFSAIRRYSTTAIAIVTSALLFGLLHMAPSSSAEIVPQLLAVALPLVAGGMVLAYVYVATGCYWSNVITHAAFNATSVVALLVFHAA